MLKQRITRQPAMAVLKAAAAAAVDLRKSQNSHRAIFLQTMPIVHGLGESDTAPPVVAFTEFGRVDARAECISCHVCSMISSLSIHEVERCATNLLVGEALCIIAGRVRDNHVQRHGVLSTFTNWVELGTVSQALEHRNKIDAASLKSLRYCEHACTRVGHNRDGAVHTWSASRSWDRDNVASILRTLLLGCMQACTALQPEFQALWWSREWAFR